MGTKNVPGEFDCYRAAEPDEPMFVLLARDPDAANLVRLWAFKRKAKTGITDKVIEALQVADAMDQWQAVKKGT